jgi:glycerol uptake facilitator-like aquaporin
MVRDRATCFVERDPGLALARRAGVEGIGTLLLMFVATASGLAASHLSPTEPVLGLLISAVAIAGALAGLIIALGAVSGGHFNPLITALQWLAAERSLRCTIAYIAAQSIGAIAGAGVADALFTAAPMSVQGNCSWAMGLSEIVASAGLMLVVFGCARSSRAETGPFAVAAWLTGAIVAMPSTSYANPAIALGAAFAAGPIGLGRQTALFYLAMEIVGALIALAIVSGAFPAARRQGEIQQGEARL